MAEKADMQLSYLPRRSHAVTLSVAEAVGGTESLVAADILYLLMNLAFLVAVKALPLSDIIWRGTQER